MKCPNCDKIVTETNKDGSCPHCDCPLNWPEEEVHGCPTCTHSYKESNTEQLMCSAYRTIPYLNEVVPCLEPEYSKGSVCCPHYIFRSGF